MPIRSSHGAPLPLGTTHQDQGVNFALFVEHTAPVKLQLFDAYTFERIFEIEIPFRTGQIRHVRLENLSLPVAYSYQILDEEFKSFELIDPYAKALNTNASWNCDHSPYRPLGLILPPLSFDWEEDAPPHHAKEDLVIYEMHIRGFTQDRSSRVAHPGTFLGMIDKIGHLKDLGVNAVEIMPLHEFNEGEYPPKEELPSPLCQFWGYSSLNYFALMNRYASNDAKGAVIQEFKQLVKELHKAKIEVILDVVYNHSAEGNGKGPTHSYKALGKEVYYLLDKKGGFANYTGCGNTLNCNHPVVLQMILDSLRYFATEFHIDGFRFDLASIFYRDFQGAPLQKPPILSAIAKDPLLSSLKLIAEPWDAAGLFQVGSFYAQSPRFSEWNSYYRDDVRRFIKGDPGMKGKFATRLSGSQDLYAHENRLPRNSINFIVSHDGFTLNDLVSYSVKHNQDNGENNADGANHNDSWNCGIEGPTEESAILNLRERQMKNFHLALMLSQGVPMLLMGDEFQHTKKGNNNSWCQDNPLNWIGWPHPNETNGFYRFYKALIHFRNAQPILRRRQFLTDADVAWHGHQPFEPRWDQEDHLIAFTLIDHESGHDLYAAFNAGDHEQKVLFPEPPAGKKWHWIVNTALASPDDFREAGPLIIEERFNYSIQGKSSLLLMAKPF